MVMKLNSLLRFLAGLPAHTAEASGGTCLIALADSSAVTVPVGWHSSTHWSLKRESRQAVSLKTSLFS